MRYCNAGSLSVRAQMNMPISARTGPGIPVDGACDRTPLPSAPRCQRGFLQSCTPEIEPNWCWTS
jgi:hypothetical protein